MNVRELRIILAEAIEDTEFMGKAHVVGGAVRDLLIHRQSPDFDITVELPDGGIKLAKFLNSKLQTSTPVCFPQFGTSKLIFRGAELEFVMTRKEVYQPGNRNPQVSFGSLEEDVWRRDFTINSLVLGISSGSLQDITGKGLEDLREGIIRTIKDPLTSFTEDPLRILRAFRYAAALGFRLDEGILRVIKEQPRLISSLSSFRLEDELCRIMQCAGPRKNGNAALPESCPGYALLQQSGMLSQLPQPLQTRLEKLSSKRFSLTSSDLNAAFGDLTASELRRMLKSSRKIWFLNPDTDKESLIKILKEKKI